MHRLTAIRATHIVRTMETQASSLLTTPAHDWATKIREKRQELGETQVQFAARFGVNQSSVAHWETGANDPPAEVTWFLYRQEQVARFKQHQEGTNGRADR